MASETVGIIGGTGWLGSGLARAMIDSGFVVPEHLLLSNRSGSHPLAEQGVRLLADNQQLVEASDTVIIAVRPEQFADVQIQAAGKRVISLMAGVTARTLSQRTGATQVVRAMANAAVDIRQSFTPWYVAGELDAADRHYVQRLLACVGTAREVPNEDCIDYLSALSGTGPAFAALLMTALSDQAIAAGIPADIAREAAKGVVVDASQLLRDHDPRQMIDSLVAYRGVTAAALQSMIDSGFEQAVGKALEAGATVARRGM
ncbi:pyrroline-5-carboxylate reductase family protein [Pseudomonas sp. NPDC090202]|uniref:pyrroline-5-carboxylate reductase family protein n=1 Tax=unclassified Pseudomonas TaxID=196821 RepID=UPI0037FAB524